MARKENRVIMSNNMIDDINDDSIVTKELTLSLGPQHPSAHGVLHLIVDLKGEKVTRAEPDIGYLHRGTEKIAENLFYPQFVPYTDRLDYMCGMTNNLGYVSAVEKLLLLELPERAKYIRVIASELSRISGHLVCIGAWGVDVGAMTILLYAMREREMVLDLFEILCGARMTYSYLRVGGVRYDADETFIGKCNDFVKWMPEKIDEYERLLTGNRIWIQRNRDIGVISKEDAISLGLGGPNLRSTGVNWDIRKDEPYLIYDELDFEVPVGEHGDCFDRYVLRIEELRQSVRIIEQCLAKMPEGPFVVDDPHIVPPAKETLYDNMENLIHHFKYVSDGFNVPAGEVYSAIESPKGELGFFIKSDGTAKPARVKIRVPSFVNLQSLDTMCKDGYLADVVAIISSLDPVFGECDK
jgi:NADH-quinone oxidoreductase subunit D